jgi:hypothetical protein
MARDGEHTTVVVKPGGLFRTILVGAFLIAVGLLLAGAIPSLNPFGSKTIDRSGPAVLKSIERLSEYRAATANLEVVVDVEEDANLLPDFLKGEKTLLIAAGRVDASVDFSRLRGSALKVSKDRKEVQVVLPAPRLTKPQLDLKRTRVFDRRRGLFDRIESVFQDSPTSDREALLLAEEKLRAAAAEDGEVLKAAEENTRAMLTGLLRGLGYERVTVGFERPPV